METPEGIDLILRPAGLLSRSIAFGIDLMIRGALLGALFFVLGTLGDFGTGLFMLALFIGTWGYMVLFEVLHQGRTPGKQIMGLRVIHDDGTPIGWSASVLRNLLRFVDMLPFGYCVGAFTCLQHPLFKRLGDLAAGTLVIYRDVPRNGRHWLKPPRGFRRCPSCWRNSAPYKPLPSGKAHFLRRGLKSLLPSSRSLCSCPAREILTTRSSN